MSKIIAFQGTNGANSHLACKKFYPNLEVAPVQFFADVFSKVENGEVDYGMIPLENSYAGRVSEIHNLLQDSKVMIVAEHFFSIEHHLAAIAGAAIDGIKEVISHPQALMQCSKNLKKLNPNLRLQEFSNTAEAAKFVALQGDQSKAALCSSAAAKANNLVILKKNLQDSGSDNLTTFVVIAHQDVEANISADSFCLGGLERQSLSTKCEMAGETHQNVRRKRQMTQAKPSNLQLVQQKNKDLRVLAGEAVLSPGQLITTLIFTIPNIHGALHKALGYFANNNVNMLKLESYIPSGASQQANFLITIEGHPNQKNVALALEGLEVFSKNVKFLGAYYADPTRFRSN